MQPKVISGIIPNFSGLSQSRGQVTHVLLTRSPLTHPPKEADALDLHVLSTPPAFVLSQDQTLQKNPDKTNNKTGTKTNQKNKLDTLLSSQKTPAHHRSLLGDIRSGSPTIPRGSGGWSVGLLTGPSEGASFCPA